MSYRKLLFVIIGGCALLFFSGCGLKEGVIEKDPVSYFWFTGNIENATVYIDDLEPIILSKSYTATESGEKIETTSPVHYKITPGKHRVIVKKRGEERVNRIILLGSGITKEINIP
jgi:hypothetical protein